MQVNEPEAAPAQLKCPWPSEMGKVAWGPCGSGELVTCGNHAYAMWRAEGAEHESQPVRNFVNAMRWPLLTEGTGLTSWQTLRPKPAPKPVAAVDPLASATRRLGTIAEGPAPDQRPSPRVPIAAAADTSTLSGIRSSAQAVTPSVTPSVRWTPGGALLSAAMLQSPVRAGSTGGAAAAAPSGPAATPIARPVRSHAQALMGIGSGAAAANRTPMLLEGTPVGAADPASTAAATDATDDDGPHVVPDKPSQHGLENMFMSLSSPGRIERPVR